MALMVAGCNEPRYDMNESSAFVKRIEEGDTVLTQEEYAQMIQLLNDGYKYMQSRIADAAFASNPSNAIKAIESFAGDTVLKAVKRDSQLFVNLLERTNLNDKNAKALNKYLKKYDELQSSLEPVDMSDD